MRAARERDDPGRGARSSSAPGCCPNPIVGITGHERQDDDDSAAGGDVPTPPGSPVEVAGNIGRPLTSLVGQRRPRRVGDLRALVLPARGRRDAAARGRGAAQPRARPPRPPRRLRGLPRREAPHLREPGGRTTSPSSRAGSAPVPGRRGASSSRATTRCRPSRGSRARTTARTPQPRRPRHARRASATTRSPRRLRTFPGVEHRIEDVGDVAGVRYVNDSKATNVAAALRALASFPDAPLHVILGGLRQGRELRAARRGTRPRRPCVPDRRGGGGDRGRARGPPVSPFERSGDLASGGAPRPRDAQRRATSSCSRPRARASTSSTASSSAGRSSGSWCRSSPR